MAPNLSIMAFANRGARGTRGPNLRTEMLSTLRDSRRLPNRSRPRLGRAMVLCIIALGLTPLTLLAANFTATLDATTVNVGENATLTLNCEGGEPKVLPGLPAIANLWIERGAKTQSINWINGQSSVSYAQSYTLTPTQPGEYTIPALSAEINGQTFTTTPLKLKATKPGSATGGQGSDQLAFFQLVPSKKEVYVGEVFSVEFRIYIRDSVADAENILRQFDAYGGCPIKAEGFSVLKTTHLPQRAARDGNVTYHVSTLVTSLTPVKTGALSIGSMD